MVSDQFDSLLAKLIVAGPDRVTALARSRRALDETVVDGVATVLPFHRAVVDDPAFTGPEVDGFTVHTRWIEADFDNQISPCGDVEDEATVPVGGRLLRVRLPGLRALGPRARDLNTQVASAGPAVDAAVTPMQGTVVKVAVSEGQWVSTGDLIAVVEAMKMENPVNAHKDGIIAGLLVQVGDVPGAGAVICTIKGEEATH
jgi:acetyl-CoA/propionyl-CoA carboxylase biotin carboxyl carrier protein